MNGPHGFSRVYQILRAANSKLSIICTHVQIISINFYSTAILYSINLCKSKVEQCVDE